MVNVTLKIYTLLSVKQDIEVITPKWAATNDIQKPHNRNEKMKAFFSLPIFI